MAVVAEIETSSSVMFCRHHNQPCPEDCMEQDQFTVGDRRELMRQSIILDTISRDMISIKDSMREGMLDLEKALGESEKRIRSLEDSRTLLRQETEKLAREYYAANESRIRSLEDTRTELKGQIKAAFFWFSIVSAGLGFAIHLVVDKMLK